MDDNFSEVRDFSILGLVDSNMLAAIRLHIQIIYLVESFFSLEPVESFLSMDEAMKHYSEGTYTES